VPVTDRQLPQTDTRPEPPPTSFLERWFGIAASGSTLAQEARAGLTTFLTMSYILFVNPAILGQAIHVPNAFGQLLFATAMASCIGSIVMGVFARYPFALAPGMGLNAYFTYSVCLAQKIPWQTALGAVFVESIIFLFLSFGGVRQAILNGIPSSIKFATTAGIGLFLALIGLENSGIVAASPATLVTLGHLGSARALITLFGLVLTSVLLIRKVPGAILYGIVAATVVAIASGAPVFDGPDGKLIPFPGLDGAPIQMPVWPRDLFLHMDVSGALKMGLLSIVFTFLFVEILDTAGTLIGLATKAGFIKGDGSLPRANEAFVADAVATGAGAILGTSTTTAYIESAAGIEEGGRTGLTAVVTGLLFGVSVFAWPLVKCVPFAATAPALILVGAMMAENLARMNLEQYDELIPGFLTVIMMPFTYSIANGVSFGIISYTILKGLTGRWRDLHPVTIALAAILVCRYIWLSE
jgi:AGZA family xanthine/uracil permease-like MFS transporter